MARDTDKKITLSNKQSWMSPISTVAYILNGLHLSSIFKFLIYVKRKKWYSHKMNVRKKFTKNSKLVKKFEQI